MGRQVNKTWSKCLTLKGEEEKTRRLQGNLRLSNGSFFNKSSLCISLNKDKEEPVKREADETWTVPDTSLMTGVSAHKSGVQET